MKNHFRLSEKRKFGLVQTAILILGMAFFIVGFSGLALQLAPLILIEAICFFGIGIVAFLMARFFWLTRDFSKYAKDKSF